MDILIRMRMLLWLMVLALWGVMIYQFIGEEGGESTRQMRWISRKFSVTQEIPDIEDEVRIPAAELFPPRPPEDVRSQPAATVVNAHTGARLARIPASIRSPRPRAPARRRPKPAPSRPQPGPPTPKGFVKTQTRHFNIYAEGNRASLEILETLSKLHANLMLDLAAFAPWARDERVSIYLFRTQESYRKVTGRPAWSGGASSVKRRKIYVYESEEVAGILAHELCHIYFDGFFSQGRENPLWLSEGMATLVQSERGLAAPNWLRPNIRKLRSGAGYSLRELMKISETLNASDDEIRLWYTQSYSVVRYLIRSQYRSSFYKFCRHLRDGATVGDALYRGYGMPFNRAKALEYAWRYDLNKGS